MIKLVITEFVENENYKEEMKEHNRPYNHSGMDHPLRTLEEKRMEVTITREQFEAMRVEVLKTF